MACNCGTGTMGGRLGQFDGEMVIPEWDVPVYDFSLPTFDVAPDYYDFAFDVPVLDTALVDTGGLTMGEQWIDPATGESWTMDATTGAWYSDWSGEVWTDVAADYGVDSGGVVVDAYGFPASEVVADTGANWSFTDEAGNEWFVDAEGNAYAVTDASGNTTFVDGAGGVVEQTSIDGSQTTAPVPQPTITDPATGSFMSFPSLKDLAAFAQTAAGIYKTVASTSGGAAPAPRTGATRTNPQTGRTEYFDSRTGQWSSRPPTGTTPRPGTLPGAQPGQLIPGVSNQTLLIGAGVVGLAFVLASRRPARRRR